MPFLAHDWQDSVYRSYLQQFEYKIRARRVWRRPLTRSTVAVSVGLEHWLREVSGPRGAPMPTVEGLEGTLALSALGGGGGHHQRPHLHLPRGGGIWRVSPSSP